MLSIAGLWFESMCLVLFAYQPDSQRPLVVAANRDEFYARPALGAHHWEDAPDLLAGRDLTAGGTWLGVTRQGRFATVTNFAEENPADATDMGRLKSRGELVESFLKGTDSAHDFARHVHGPDYRGFNLLLFDGHSLVYTCNRGFTQDLDAGVYGLANAELGASWPKVVGGTAALSHLLQDGACDDAFIRLLRDESQPDDSELPHRGRPIELERRVAPCFIRGDEYGTRASTAVIFEAQEIRFTEQGYGARGILGARTSHRLQISSASP